MLRKALLVALLDRRPLLLERWVVDVLEETLLPGCQYMHEGVVSSVGLASSL